MPRRDIRGRETKKPKKGSVNKVVAPLLTSAAVEVVKKKKKPEQEDQ